MHTTEKTTTRKTQDDPAHDLGQMGGKAAPRKRTVSHAKPFSARLDRKEIDHERQH